MYALHDDFIAVAKTENSYLIMKDSDERTGFILYNRGGKFQRSPEQRIARLAKTQPWEEVFGNTLSDEEKAFLKKESKKNA